MKQYILIVGFLLMAQFSHSQVLISLLFGEKLNSEKVEFGLIGGLNRSYWHDVSESEGMNNFNLGFYFHFLLHKNSYISTGVLVKSNVGAEGMPTYSIGDPAFDDVFKDGSLKTKLNYFYVPILYQHRFNNRWYIEGGFQPGLRYKTHDYFEVSNHGGDLSYEADVGDNYKRLDFGLLGGVGYKLRKQTKSTSIGVSYYSGFVDVSKIPNSKRKNASLLFFCKIPIGTGKTRNDL